MLLVQRSESESHEVLLLYITDGIHMDSGLLL